MGGVKGGGVAVRETACSGTSSDGTLSESADNI